MTKLRLKDRSRNKDRKNKLQNQIFRLEDRVLYDGAAAADVVAAVNAASEQHDAQNDSDSDQDKEQKLVNITVQAAGPVDTPAPEANVQNDGEGLPQADDAQNDPAQVLIQGNVDFSHLADASDAFSSQPDAASANSIEVASQTPAELLIINAKDADQIDPELLEGKSVIIIDPDSDFADQISAWLEDHDDQQFDSIKIIADSDSDSFDSDDFGFIQEHFGDQVSVESLSLSEFTAEQDSALSGLTVFPDHHTSFTVFDSSLDDELLPEALENPPEEGRHELVILNSTTADLDNVLEQLGDSRDILILDHDSDAFEQISVYLDNSDTAYDAVHILTHGNDGGVVLGSQYVNDAGSFAVFADHLTSDGDIMFYGCDMAATERGQLFIQNIADVTGADVAASTDITGAQLYNGDWSLEYSTGTIETASISLDSSWEHRLTAYTINGTSDPEHNLYASLAELAGTDFVHGDSIVYDFLEAKTDNITGSTFTFTGNVDIIAQNNDVTIIGGTFNAGGANNDLLRFYGTGFTVDGMAVNGNVDARTNITAAGDSLTVDGTLIMRTGTTLNLNADAAIDTVDLKNATFANAAGVTLTGDVVSNTNIAITNSLTIDGTLLMKTGTTLNLNAAHVDIDNVWMRGTSTLNLLVDGSTTIGTATMESGSTLNLDANTAIGTLVLENGANFHYTADKTLTGDVDSNTDIAIGNALTIDGTLTMNGAHTLTLNNTDTDITSVVMTNGSTLNLNANAAIDTVVLENGSIFNFTNGVELTGSLDYGIKATPLTLAGGSSMTITETLTMEDGTTLNLNTDATIGTVELLTGSHFAYTPGVELTGSLDYGIADTPLTLAGGSLTISGTLTMEANTTLELNANATIGTVQLNPDSTFTYTDGVTLTGMIDSYTDVTLNDSITIDALTMESGTKLTQNADVTIGTVQLNPDSTFTYANTDIILDGSVDSYTNVTLDDSITITGTLTMESGTADDPNTLTLNANATIGTVQLNNGSSFDYAKKGVTLDGNITSYIDLNFDDGEFTIEPGSIISLHAGAMTVAKGSTLNLSDATITVESDFSAVNAIVNKGTLNLSDATITVESDSSAVNAIVNEGTLNLHEANVITFGNTVSAVYSGVLNTGTVNIVKADGDASAALTVNFGNVNNTFEKNGLMNNGKEAVINITAGSLTVTSSANAQQPVYAINNALGKTSDDGGVSITSGSTVKLDISGNDHSGTKSAAVFNANDQLVTIGTKDGLDGSRIELKGNANENYAVYNNGTAKIYNSFIVATTGDQSIGLFNSTSGTMIVNVSEAPNKYVTAAAINAGTANAYNLTYGVSGTAYSVYNLGKFTGKTSGDSENITVDESGTYGEVTLTDVPILLFNGEFHTQGKSSGTGVETNLSNAVVIGEITSTQTAQISLDSVYFSSKIVNSGSTISITGEFRSPEKFSLAAKGGSTLESEVYVGGTHKITNQKFQLGSSGNIYFANVTFNPGQNYYFENLAGTMTVYNFTGLSSVDHPVTIHNEGQFSMDADTSSETPYTLYVTYAITPGTYTSDIVADVGIFNMDGNSYDTYTTSYPVINEMVLSDLDIVNANANSVGVTNLGGNLTIHRGSIQATYSGIDSLFNCQMLGAGTSNFHISVNMANTVLDNLTRISGARASVRNDGYLTLNGSETGTGDEAGTLLTNTLDGISSSYTDEYIAVWNSSPEYFLKEHYYSDGNPAMHHYIYTGTKVYSAFQLTTATSYYNDSTPAPSSILGYFGGFTFFTAAGKTATQIPLPVTPDTANYNGYKTEGSNPVHYYYEWGNAVDNDFTVRSSAGYAYTVASEAGVDGVKLQSTAGTADTVAFRNWGKLTVSGINSSEDYRFKGFTVSVDQGRSDNIIGNSNFIPTGDYTIGFELDSAASIRMNARDGQYNDIILRGISNGDGTYSGGMKATSEYVVYKKQSLTLENFKVTADDNAFIVHGSLFVYNGQLDPETGEYKGPSDSYITAGGTAVELGTGGFFFMINGAITEANIGIDILANGGTAAIINSTLYNNTIGIQSNYANDNSVYVVNSTIVSVKAGSIGIRQTAGTANITNSVILVSGGKGVDGNSSLSGENIIGADEADTMTKLKEVFGVESFNDLVFVERYQAVTLVEDSTARSAQGSEVSYTLTPGTSPSISFGEGITITLDKAGNERGQGIGSYLGFGDQPIVVPMLVTTLLDKAADPDEDQLSLRYVVNYLLSAKNTDASYIVKFDWDKLIAEAGESKDLMITLSNDTGYGSVDIDFKSKVSDIDTLIIDASDIVEGYTLTVDGLTNKTSAIMVAGLPVVFQGFTIRGGGTEDGAALWVGSGAVVTLDAMTFSGTDSTGNGTVYVAENGELVLNNTNFIENKAGNGGAIYNAGGKVSGSAEFVRNQAIENGGAVAVTAGSVTINGSFQGNAAAGNGGAIYSEGGTVNVTGNITADAEGTGNSAAKGSAVYASGGFVQIGSLDTYSTITGNGGSLFDVSGSGELLVVNTSISGNGTGSAGDLFAVSEDGKLTLLNTTVNNNANTGNWLNQTGGTVQIGDSTIYQPTSKVAFTGGILNVFNSIINVSGSFNPTNPAETQHSVINGDPTEIFSWKDGEPELAANGTLKLKMSGPAAIGGALVGYSYDAESGTTLYYTTDGTNWYDAEGKPAQDQEAITAVTTAQNGVARVYADYDQVNIGAYSISAGSQSLVVTLGGDESQDTGTTLREALEYAAFLYNLDGKTRTVTFKVDEVTVGSTITIDSPVNISGGVTVKSDPASFADASVFTLIGGDVLLTNMTVEGMTGVRGIDVNGANLKLSNVTVRNGDMVSAGSNGGAILFQKGTLSGSNVKLLDNKAVNGAAIQASGSIDLSNVTISGNESTAGDVINAGGSVKLSGTVSDNTASDNVINAGRGVSVSGSVRDNTVTKGDVIRAGSGNVNVGASVSGNMVTEGNVIRAGSGNVLVSGNVSGNEVAKGNVIRSGSGDVTVTGSVNGNTASGNVIQASSVTVNNGVVNGNTAGSSVINASGNAVVLNSTLSNNTARSGAVVSGGDVTLANTTMAYNNGDAVNAGGTAKIANSIVLGNVNGSDTQAAYGIFSSTPSNMSVNDSNVMNANPGSLFAGRDSSGRLIIREDSVAAVGVWTAYDAKQNEVYYSTRPEWTDNYNPANMQWNQLGGGTVPYETVSSMLLTPANRYPSIGNYSSGSSLGQDPDSGYHPDLGPGVNSGMADISFSGGLMPDWGFNSVVNSVLMNPGTSLYGDDESGMGWYAALLSGLFGSRAQQTSIFSVAGGIPKEELDLSVDSADVEFEDFEEAPYHAEDGTPLDQTELNAIRTAAVTGHRPEDTLHLDDEVDNQVAASLRSAELFKDSFDKALDALLGLDA